MVSVSAVEMSLKQLKLSVWHKWLAVQLLQQPLLVPQGSQAYQHT